MTIPRDRAKPTTIEVVGASGPACEEMTRLLEARLGGNAMREHKQEYFEEPVHQDLKVGGE